MIISIFTFLFNIRIKQKRIKYNYVFDKYSNTYNLFFSFLMIKIQTFKNHIQIMNLYILTFLKKFSK